MGKFIPQPDVVRAALEQRLAPGEQIRYAAYGLQQSALIMGLVIFALMIPAVLINLVLVGSRAGLFGTLTFFIIWMGLMAPVIPLLRKDYLVGLTDQRLLVQRVKTPMFTINLGNVLSFTDYPLSQLKGARTKIGPMRVFIKLKDARQSLNLQFGGRGLTGNYQQAAEIARALN
ncbi:MAG: hypothetical protein ACREEM_41635 [Blastocatellia bacterium]